MKLPSEIIMAVERELSGLGFGKVNLECLCHDSKIRFRLIKETSYIPGKDSSGIED